MNDNLAAPSLSKLLMQVFKLHRTRIHAVLDVLGLHRGQAFVLGVLGQHDGLSQSRLAEKMLVQPATVTDIVQRMEQAELVVRRTDPLDQRISRVYLTAAGQALEAPLRRVWEDLEAETFRGFSSEERIAMHQFLRRMVDNLADVDPAAPCVEDVADVTPVDEDGEIE